MTDDRAMGLRLQIPETGSLRRLAASLSTSLVDRVVLGRSLDLGLSASVFFRYFPWTGVMIPRASLPDLRNNTVGQYFAQFNWEGLPLEPETDRVSSGELPRIPAADESLLVGTHATTTHRQGVRR
jgi:hypothetical protein